MTLTTYFNPSLKTLVNVTHPFRPNFFLSFIITLHFSVLFSPGLLEQKKAPKGILNLSFIPFRLLFQLVSCYNIFFTRPSSRELPLLACETGLGQDKVTFSSPPLHTPSYSSPFPSSSRHRLC